MPCVEEIEEMCSFELTYCTSRERFRLLTDSVHANYNITVNLKLIKLLVYLISFNYRGNYIYFIFIFFLFIFSFFCVVSILQIYLAVNYEF